MVVGQILSHKRLLELAGRPRERDGYLMEQVKVDKIVLGCVRRIFSESVVETQTSFEVESLSRAAEILGKRDPKFITEMNLAALIFTDWDDPASQAKKVHYQLKKLYKEERKGFLAEFGFKLPYIEFLRQEVTGRELNCLKARGKYKNFEVSREDVLRNISLPSLSYETCMLLAGFWGRASLNLSSGRYVVQLSGGEDDFDFYENWVKEAIWKAHNLEVKVESVSIEGYETRFPRIFIASRAIATWLKHDLGFPKPKENVNLPNLGWNEERKQGFFDGIIAFMGGSLGRWRDIAIHDHDFQFIENLSQLARELGYTPNIMLEKFEERSISYRLYFSPWEVKRMNLINPKHLLKSKKGG